LTGTADLDISAVEYKKIIAFRNSNAIKKGSIKDIVVMQ
jgi:hypothetical protein